MTASQTAAEDTLAAGPAGRTQLIARLYNAVHAGMLPRVTAGLSGLKGNVVEVPPRRRGSDDEPLLPAYVRAGVILLRQAQTRPMTRR